VLGTGGGKGCDGEVQTHPESAHLLPPGPAGSAVQNQTLAGNHSQKSYIKKKRKKRMIKSTDVSYDLADFLLQEAANI